MPTRRPVCAALIATAFCALAMPQAAHARNKVRDTRFDWRVLKTEHFDIHFYDEDVVPRAREVGAWLEGAFTRLATRLQLRIRYRVPVFLYRNHNHFEQTNLYGNVPEGVGAFAESTLNRLVLPLYASERYMQTVLEHELVHIYQFAALYPYRIPSWLLLKAWLLPSWFMEGMADHLAPPRGADAAMRLRDTALDGRLRPVLDLHGFSHLGPHEIRHAYEHGAAFFDYLDEVSGGGSAMRLLRMASLRIPWRVDTLFALATGTALRGADADFRESTIEKARAASSGKADPGAMAVTRDRGHFHVYNRSPAWSPGGERVAFLSDRMELTSVYALNADGSGTRELLRGKLNASIESVKGGDNALAWSPDGSRLCFVGEWTNREYLYAIDSRDGRNVVRRDVELDELASPRYSPDGRRVAFSGVAAGVSDIYLIDLETNDVERLTTTRAHDDAPSWSPDGSRIAFSSEVGGQSDIYVVDVATKSVERITDTLSVERHPDWSPDGKRLAYTSDAGGFWNIHELELASGTARAVTDVIGGAFSPAWSPSGRRIAFSYYRHGNMNLYVAEVGPGGSTNAPAREESRAAEFAPFRTGSVDGDDETFEDRFRVETVLPLYLTNPFSFTDLRGDHQIVGDVAPFVSEVGSTFQAQLSYLDLSRRADIVATAFQYVTASDTIEDRDEGGRINVSYPFDHFRSVSFGYIEYRRERQDLSGPVSSERHAGLFLGVAHDNRVGRGMDVTAGCLYAADVKYFDDTLSSDRSLTSYSFEHARYSALTRDQILAMRVRIDTSKGPQPEAFDISDVVRGAEPNAHEDRNRFGLTLEYRFPVARDLKTHLLGSYLMLKDIRGYLFADAGYVTGERWNRPFDDIPGPLWHHSLGLGLRFDLFLFQKAPFRLVIESQRVDNDWQRAAGLVLEFQF